MNGYVEAGYAVVLGTLGAYSITLVARGRAAQRRTASTAASAADSEESGDKPDPEGSR
jgi:hypothetical protein